jgi:two-component system CheB/CheR fusion protein
MARQHPARRIPSNATAKADADELRKLQERVKRYELIFQATNDVVYELNLDDGTVDWNEALYTQYGYSPDEPTDTLEWWTSRVHPDDAFLLENKITDLFESDTSSWQYDYRFRRADGKYNYVHDRGLLLRDHKGQPKRIIGSLLDMTAQKQLDIAKDEFISLVSHQLRTPLTVIRVYGEMLTNGMSGKLSAEQAQWVHNMTNSSSRLIDVVGDILNVSRLDLGRINITAHPLDVATLIKGCIHEVQPLADEKHITFTFEPLDDLPPVRVDQTIMTQIVHNLLTNAIRYTKPNKGAVRVSFEPWEDGYRLTVQDNGIGIPKDAADHIFERFYRAKNALSVETQGSGLGLYLIKVMTDAFGGRVWFEPVPGKGTAFHVSIPAHGMVLGGQHS